MLTQIANGVFVHQSALIQNNAVIVQGAAGVLLVDPGLTRDEMRSIAHGLRDMGQQVEAGFATHPDWDHVLWYPEFGLAPRYGTALCAEYMEELLATADWKDRVAGVLPPDIAEQIPIDDTFGRIVGLPADATRVPWHGPEVRVIEHRAHATGHAALLVADLGVFIAGDMLSDVLVPMLNFEEADPVGDYLASLQLFEDSALGIEVIVPGHGSVGDAREFQLRIDRDRAYVIALRDGRDLDDPRIGDSAPAGWEWVNDIHQGQVRQLAQA